MFYILLDQGDPNHSDACSITPASPRRLIPSECFCPVCQAPLEPGRWEGPHHAEILGAQCGDLIEGAGFEMAISQVAWENFEACGITGWTLSGPLDTADSREFVIVRPHVSLTRLDEARSEMQWLRPPSCERCRLGVRKSVGALVFDPATLDGTDIFVPSGAYGLKVVTQKFKDCAEASKLRNFRLIPAEEYRE